MAQLPQRRIAVGAGPGCLADAVADLDLPTPATTLVVNGETGDNAAFPAERVREVLRSLVRALADCPGPVIVSGGTRAGIFALLGELVAELGFAGPVIGVVPAGRIERANGTPLEPHHTGILMTAGDEWGDETPILLGLCRELERRGPVVAVVAGGGQQTLVEVQGHRADRRTVVALRGSGRAADQIAGMSPQDGVVVVDIAGPAGVGLWRSVLQTGRT